MYTDVQNVYYLYSKLAQCNTCYDCCMLIAHEHKSQWTSAWNTSTTSAAKVPILHELLAGVWSDAHVYMVSWMWKEEYQMIDCYQRYACR